MSANSLIMVRFQKMSVYFHEDKVSTLDWRQDTNVRVQAHPHGECVRPRQPPYEHMNDTWRADVRIQRSKVTRSNRRRLCFYSSRLKYGAFLWVCLQTCALAEIVGSASGVKRFEENLLSVVQECVPLAVGAIRLEKQIGDWSDAWALLWDHTDVNTELLLFLREHETLRRDEQQLPDSSLSLRPSLDTPPH